VKGKCVCSNNSINEDCSEDEFFTPSSRPSPILKNKNNKNSSNKQAKLKLRIYDKMNFRELDVDSKKTKLKFNSTSSSTSTSIKYSGNKSENKTENNLEILSSILKVDDYQKRFIYSGILLSMIFLVTITTVFLNKKFNLYEQI
jgi:hypothetical protein